MRQFSDGDWLDEEIRARIQQRVAEQMENRPAQDSHASPAREPQRAERRAVSAETHRVPPAPEPPPRRTVRGEEPVRTAEPQPRRTVRGEEPVRTAGPQPRRTVRGEEPIRTAEPRNPRRRPKKKKSRRPYLIPLIAVLAIVLAAVIVHTALVRAPEIVVDEEGTAPALLAADRRPGVYTFLLVGRDDGGGGNTDTIMACTFDTVNGRLDALSIFRDTMVDVPWEIKKINSVFNRQGIEGLREQVKNLIGYAPDYYFVMELSVVQELVDCIGGVDFDVPYNMSYDDPTQDLHIHFKKGYQHLNGKETVELLRWRKNNSTTDNSDVSLSLGDVGRVSVQHDVLSALTKQAARPENILKLKDIISIFSEKVQSDLTYGELLWFGERLLGMDSESAGFYNLPGNYNGTAWSDTYHNYQSYVLVNADELRDLVNLHLNPYLVNITADMQHVINSTTENDQIVLPEAKSGSQGAQAVQPAVDDNNEAAVGSSATTYQAPAIRDTEPDLYEQIESGGGTQPVAPPIETGGSGTGTGTPAGESNVEPEPAQTQEPAADPVQIEPAYTPAEPEVPADPGGSSLEPSSSGTVVVPAPAEGPAPQEYSPE